MKGLLLILLFPFLSLGTVVIPPDFRQLVSIADTILDATVTDVRCVKETHEGSTVILTRVTLSIHEVVKGTAKSPYVLELLGGTVGNETLTVEGAPQFQKGDRALFFIEKNGTNAIPLVGMMHGHYWIETDPTTGAETVFKPDGVPLFDSGEIDTVAKEPASPEESPRQVTRRASPLRPLSPREFKKEIQTFLKARP